MPPFAKARALLGLSAAPHGTHLAAVPRLRPAHGAGAGGSAAGGGPAGPAAATGGAAADAKAKGHGGGGGREPQRLGLRLAQAAGQKIISSSYI